MVYGTRFGHVRPTVSDDFSLYFLAHFGDGGGARAERELERPRGAPCVDIVFNIVYRLLRVRRAAHPVVPRLHNGLILNRSTRPPRRYQMARRRRCRPRRLRRRRRWNLRGFGANSGCGGRRLWCGTRRVFPRVSPWCGTRRFFRACRRTPPFTRPLFRVGFVGMVGTVPPPSPGISRFVFAVVPPP
jgi:hypothetical protein